MLKLTSRITLALGAGWLFLSGCVSTSTRTSPPPSPPVARETAPEEKIYRWLVHQQGAHGILGNQEGETFSATYPNALAAICFLHQGDVDRAEKIFRFFQKHYDECFASAPGGFYQFWDAGTGEGLKDSDRWIGDNAWLLIALNYHRQRTGKTEFDGMRDGMARWLIGLQDADGGIKSGYNKNGLMDSKSTEGNLDCHAALIDYPAERAKVRTFLESQMWIPSENRFKMGSTCPDPAMDTSAWGVQSLGLDYVSSLDYADQNFLRTRVAKASGKSMTAYSDFKDKDRIWLEGSGEMAVAWHVAGNKEKARSTLRELEKALVASDAFPGAAGMPCHTNDPAWETGADKIFVPSQAWYLYGAWGFNPMDPEQRVEKIHVVKPGETLSKIAGYGHIYGNPAKWKKIYEANRKVLASVDQIRPGQKLVIP